MNIYIKTLGRFIMGTLTKNEKKLTRPFNFTFLYTDNVLSINNSKFGDYADLIYATELEVNDATDTGCSALYASVSEVFMIYRGRLFFRAESSLIQSNSRSLRNLKS
jgi:hypothetical protein